jgi:leucyl aminopeptidase
MTDFQPLLVADKGEAATLLHLVDRTGFRGEPNQIAILTGDGADWAAAIGVARPGELGPWCLAKAAETLPEGRYRLQHGDPAAAALGWLLGQYSFNRYKAPKNPKGARILLTAEPARIDETLQLANATALVRDLVNTPAGDLGPAGLEDAARSLAAECAAEINVTAGRALAEGYPMIAGVGQGATQDRAPRLIEIMWGNSAHPRIALVGKGVCFDTGGLDIKPSSGMRLMKKDMGGAAHVLGLARLIMKRRLPVRLHVLIPAVENSISGAAFRPGDVLKSRKGLTVEIGNTDAEGRLILGDALTRAGESDPELILDFATLTGAARVALGPDLPALFANDDALAGELLACGHDVTDPLWRMPLWDGYDEMLSSDIADLGNVSDAPMAGAVTAALFLRRFVPEGIAWAHFDTFAWRSSARPGRAKGGDALGLRAAWALLSRRYAVQD